MADLFSLLNSLFGMALLVGLILAALLMPFAFAYACKLLKRLILMVLLWALVPIAFCILAWEFRNFSFSIGGVGPALLILFGLISAGAYLIYKVRHRAEKKPMDLRRIERQPLMPEHLTSTLDRHGQHHNERQE